MNTRKKNKFLNATIAKMNEIIRLKDEICDNETSLKHAYREEVESLKRSLFGENPPANPIVARRNIMIDDRECGALPCFLVRLTRQGRAYDDYENVSMYSADLVMDRNAVLTGLEAHVAFDAIRSLMEFVVHGGSTHN